MLLAACSWLHINASGTWDRNHAHRAQIATALLCQCGQISFIKQQQGYLEEHELAAKGGLVHVHEGGQLGQRDGCVQLEQLLEGGQVLLLLHHALEAPQLQPVRFLRQHTMGSGLRGTMRTSFGTLCNNAPCREHMVRYETKSVLPLARPAMTRTSN